MSPRRLRQEQSDGGTGVGAQGLWTRDRRSGVGGQGRGPPAGCRMAVAGSGGSREGATAPGTQAPNPGEQGQAEGSTDTNPGRPETPRRQQQAEAPGCAKDQGLLTPGLPGQAPRPWAAAKPGEEKRDTRKSTPSGRQLTVPTPDSWYEFASDAATATGPAASRGPRPGGGQGTQEPTRGPQLSPWQRGSCFPFFVY